MNNDFLFIFNNLHNINEGFKRVCLKPKSHSGMNGLIQRVKKTPLSFIMLFKFMLKYKVFKLNKLYIYLVNMSIA